MNELSISKKYPVQNFNLLGNTDVIVQIPDIKSPVIQVVKLDANPDKGEVYIQQKEKKHIRTITVITILRYRRYIQLRKMV